MRILVVRNDRLGDFMLAWPAFALLRKYLPEAKIEILVPKYTASIAALNPWINEIVLMPEGDSSIQLAKLLKRRKYDAMISLYSTSTVAIAGWLAAIPVRMAPASRWVQIFATARIRQRRSRSIKPEYAYNCDLIYAYLKKMGINPEFHVSRVNDDLPCPLQRPLLTLAESDIENLQQKYRKKNRLTGHQQLIFLHPGSGGSATTLQINQYEELVRRLTRTENRLRERHFVISAGPGEEKSSDELLQRLQQLGISSSLLTPENIIELTHYLALANLLISASTGPLHIAGALNRPTATFYPGNRSASPLRWQPLNQPDYRIAFTPPEGGDPKEVSRTNIKSAAEEIDALLLRLYP